jgi:ubiquinone/menaquinone biosynthesis C-methylase UbiE
MSGSSSGEVTLSHSAARALYDRIGRWQDTQRFYEDHATNQLLAHAALQEARAVFEFGTGTGRLAERLLRSYLSPMATYQGVDISSTMVELARRRLASWHDRAVVQRSDGSPYITAPAHRFDRFLSTFVLDLLSRDDIAVVLGEAHRLLAPSGFLGLVSATHGVTRVERAVMGVAGLLHRLSPTLVGGCRALELHELMHPSRWRIVHREVTSKWGIPSEVLIATPVNAPT